MIDAIVGSYRIVGKLSEGGMGAVFRAEHTLIGRLAAVKILHPEFCANQEIVKRFFNEARATTAIKHPGIVEILDFGYMPSGHAFLVMEFLDGMPLTSRMKLRGPLPEGEAAMVIRGVCSALSAAHAKGIVHRDLKPDNIFVIPDPDSPLGERCKLLDFGIAKLTDIGLAGSATRTGAVMGTPTYMSPEQCKGTGAVDHRADLYSMGCILYELLTGRPPFTALGAGELIGAHLYKQPEPPSRHVPISAEFEALIMSLLDKEPDRRVQTARDLGVYLTQIAMRDGWAPNATETDRISMQHITGDHTGTPAHLTPGPRFYTPVFPTGDRHTPVPPPPRASAPTIAAGATDPGRPTTLSSATGQPGATAAPAPSRSRRGLGIAIGVGAVAVIAGVAMFALRDPAASSTAPAAATAEPAPPAAAPEPPPAPPPPPAAEVQPAVAAPADPPPAPPPATPPPAPPEPAPSEPGPAVAAPAAKKPATGGRPGRTPKAKPATTTTTRPATSAPATGPLLEESL